MKLIRPTLIVDSGTPDWEYATLTSTDVPDTTEAEWAIGTSYTAGQVVWASAAGGAHILYTATAASPNVGNSPPTSLTYWTEGQAINRWKMFDYKNGSQTSQVTSIEVVLTLTSIIDSLALMNVYCSSAQLVMMVGAVERYNVTLSGTSNENVIDWWSYFFETRSPVTDLFFKNIPPYPDGVLTLTVTSGSTVLIGECVVGLSKNIGKARWGVNVELVDWSRKGIDSDGNYYVDDVGVYSKRMSVDLFMTHAQSSDVFRTIAKYRAFAMVWVVDEEYALTIIFGFFTRHTIVLTSPAGCDGTIEIEGLT
jgi:hypothetical protein